MLSGLFCVAETHNCTAKPPGARIMEADDRQVTTVFTVQPPFHHQHSTNRLSWSVNHRRWTTRWGEAPGRVATGVPIFKSLVWLDPGKIPAQAGIEPLIFRSRGGRPNEAVKKRETEKRYIVNSEKRKKKQTKKQNPELLKFITRGS